LINQVPTMKFENKSLNLGYKKGELRERLEVS